MANIPQLQPENQFPTQAVDESLQKFPKPETGVSGNVFLTFNIASAADTIIPWGKDVYYRDRQLREFWPTESNLAGAMANICLRNAAFDWVIKAPSSRLETVVTDMLKSALGPSGQIGWTSKEIAVSEDWFGTDNGAFEELIRDPGVDANSKFKDEKAPVIGIGHLDSGQCRRTGNPEYPVLYTDRNGKVHKLAWYQVIPFCEMPSSIASMNGVGVCAVSRVLRMAEIMKSISILTNEMVSGRNFNKINIIGGVSRTDIEDAKKRGQETADNMGHIRYIEHVILASLDPEKPVSVASVDLAGFPPDFNYDIWMKWYISTLALGFVVDYQDFAPLPGGNIGSSSQSEILSKKSSAKGPANYMRTKAEAYKIYGVLPRGCELVYDDKNQAEELERQVIRTKAMEEYALALRNGVLTPEAVRKDAVRRGIYDKVTVEGIIAEYGNDIVAPKQNLGQVGGNTRAEDASRTNTGAQNNTGSDRLQKERLEEQKGILEVVKSALSFGRKPIIIKSSQQPAQVKVDVHNHPGKAPDVKVTNVMQKQAPQRVVVNVPKQTAPVVNVTTPEVKVQNTVNVPEIKIPATVVNVPPANVNVTIPPRPKDVKIEYDADGKPTGLKAE